MKRNILGALVAAAAMVGAAWALRFMHIPGEDAKLHAINVILGILVIWIANNTPKQLAPLSALGCSAEREQRVRRMSGMLIFAGGLVYSLAWLVTPMWLAFPLSMAALGSAVAATLAVCLLAMPRRRT
jgi:dolichol kinase